MENLKSNSWLIDSKCGECFRKEMKCCLQQMEVCKFSFHFRARITVSGDEGKCISCRVKDMNRITELRKQAEYRGQQQEHFRVKVKFM